MRLCSSSRRLCFPALRLLVLSPRRSSLCRCLIHFLLPHPLRCLIHSVLSPRRSSSTPLPHHSARLFADGLRKKVKSVTGDPHTRVYARNVSGSTGRGVTSSTGSTGGLGAQNSGAELLFGHVLNSMLIRFEHFCRESTRECTSDLVVGCLTIIIIFQVFA